MEFRFALRDNGMRAAFQLLHMVLEVGFQLTTLYTHLCCYRRTPFSLMQISHAYKILSPFYSIMCG